MFWAAFWATFSQSHLVTLKANQELAKNTLQKYITVNVENFF
jgi:hypothetical protein